MSLTEIIALGFWGLFFLGIVLMIALALVFSLLLFIEDKIKRKERVKLLDSADAQYSGNPSLLRGQDYLAAMWYDRIRGKRYPDPVLEYKLVAVATFLEREAGRFYFDGRPVQQGWMTKKDVEDYIDYILSHGDSKFRYEVFLRGKRFGHRNGRVRRLERAMDRWLAQRNKMVAHPGAVDAVVSDTTEEDGKKDAQKSSGESIGAIGTMIAER